MIVLNQIETNSIQCHNELSPISRKMALPLVTFFKPIPGNLYTCHTTIQLRPIVQKLEHGQVPICALFQMVSD